METPSFNCICGKTYRYRSGLSKHQRGSQSEGTLPCPSFANGIAESATDRALAERLTECFENAQVPDNHKVIDYSVSNIIPLGVTFEGVTFEIVHTKIG